VTLERDRDTLRKRYADSLPEALDALNSEERHRLYKMPRLQVTTKGDGTLMMSGVLTDGLDIGESEPTSPCRFPLHKSVALRFSALLDHESPEVKLALM
jgi:hypothetical protein